MPYSYEPRGPRAGLLTRLSYKYRFQRKESFALRPSWNVVVVYSRIIAASV